MQIRQTSCTDDQNCFRKWYSKGPPLREPVLSSGPFSCSNPQRTLSSNYMYGLFGVVFFVGNYL